ncbi:MAG: SPFH domain-containing protein [Planctomycetes bacterium]|nr:SPFH domain-containing protein [Planctomycetota bacterium]
MTQERNFEPFSGALFAILGLLCVPAVIACIVAAKQMNRPDIFIPGMFVFVLIGMACFAGLFLVNPNEAKVLVLFGRYRGTVKSNGFYWVNPFTMRHRVSLRAHNLNGEKLKVNDKSGNPIEIAAVVVWQVHDTFAAKFDVESYEDFVKVQSEAAVRHMASAYHYDGEDGEITLRGSTDEVSRALQEELGERLERAGVEVTEARLAHLAYAPEIAQAMLQRQQAAAVIAARTKIVDGAVGMVEMALARLSHSGVVKLDEERKAAMVSNLLVVLCGERTTPIVNAGTIYQ